MSYHKELEDRIDHFFIDNEKLVKNKRLGWVGWLINGNMFAGIYGDLLIARMKPQLIETLIEKEGIDHFEQEESPDQFVSLTSEIYSHPKALHKFLTHSYEFTSSLPPKEHDLASPGDPPSDAE